MGQISILVVDDEKEIADLVIRPRAAPSPSSTVSPTAAPKPAMWPRSPPPAPRAPSP